MAERKTKPSVAPKPKVIPVDRSYGMSLSRLGNAIIINNVSGSVPGSEADVKRLKEAYETVGFDVFIYRDPNAQELKRTKAWMTMAESHKYCNAFSLVVIGRGTDAGDLLDCNGESFSTVQSLIDQISRISTLFDKPKFFLAQRYVSDMDYETVILPYLPTRKDMCLVYTIKNENTSQKSEIEYIQTFAQQLQKYFMDKPAEKILHLIDQCMKQKAVLSDAILMELSREVSGRDVASLGLEKLEIEHVTIRNLGDSRRDNIQMFTFDVLCLWRNKSVDNTKQKLREIMLESAEKYGDLNPDKVRGILEIDSEAVRESYVMVIDFSMILHFCDFHVAERRKIRQLEDKIKQMEINMESTKSRYKNDIHILRMEIKHRRQREKEKLERLKEKMEREKKDVERKTQVKIKSLEKEKENYYDHFQKEMRSLRAEKDRDKEIAVQMEKEKLRVVQEAKRRQEEEMRNRIKQLEEENRTKQQTLTSEDNDKIKMLEESLIRVTVEKDRYEKQIHDLQQEVEEERTHLQEAEVCMIRNLEETVELSTQKLRTLKKKFKLDEPSNESDDNSGTEEHRAGIRLQHNNQVLKEEGALAEFEAKIYWYEGETKSLEKNLEEAQENEKRTKANLEMKQTLITRYGKEIQQLQEELKEAKEAQETEKRKIETKMDANDEVMREEFQNTDEQSQNITHEKALINQYKMEIKQLQEELTEAKDGKKTEVEKFRLKISGQIRNEVELRKELQEKYDKQIKSLKDQVYHDSEMIHNLTEEKNENKITLKEMLTTKQKEKDTVEEEGKVKIQKLEGQLNISKEQIQEKRKKLKSLLAMMTEEHKEIDKKKIKDKEKIKKTEDLLKNVYQQIQTLTFKYVELNLISRYKINLRNIRDMTVMRETGLIVVISGQGNLHQLSLQEGCLIEKEIKPPCEHEYLYLLCVQVAGSEYLALSCHGCRDINLMNFNKQKGYSSESQLIQYEVIRAFSDEKVGRMCHGEENRLFVESGGVVLELDTSTTPFKKVKTINIDAEIYDLSYVPDPDRLLVVRDGNEVRTVSCDNKTTWTLNDNDFPAGELVYTPTHESIIVADRYRNNVVILDPSDGSRLQFTQLPDYVREIRGMCVYNNQLIVCRADRISYFFLK